MFRKHRIPAANKKPFDRKAFLGKALLFASCLAVAGGVFGLCFLVFGGELGRWGSSLSFLWESLEASFGSSGKAAAPNAPNIGTADYGSLSSAFQNFAFLYQTACGLLLNQHWLQEWGVGQERILLRIMQLLMYVPIPFILYLCAKKIVSGMKPQGKQEEKTKPLLAYARISGAVGPKARAAKAALRAYIAPESRGRYWKLAWVAAALAASPVGPTLLDFATGYLFFLFTLSTDEIKPLFLSNMTDLWVTLRQLGWLNLIWIGMIVFLILRKSALDTLRQMQAANYERAQTKAVGIFITGMPGTGKTTMMTSLGLDYEYVLREQLLGDMRQARNAFPGFPWARLEGWIRKMGQSRELALPSGDPTEANGAPVESKGLVTRAQIEFAIKSTYAIWRKQGMADRVEGKEYLFGYGGNNPATTYFDGAKEWELLDAIQSYAGAYFLYFSGLSLITSNYSITDRTGVRLSTYPLYGKNDDYLRKGCSEPGKALGMSAVLEWDGFRLGKKVGDDAEALRQQGHFDGGALLLDELSLERGNSREHYAKGDDSGKATPENDSFNATIKLIRHFYSNNNKPVVKAFGNTQRGGATGTDLVSMFEESDWIDSNDGEDNALPLWAADSAVCGWAVGLAYGWLDLRKNRELRQTLSDKIVFGIAKIFDDHKERMGNSYGFERLHVIGWSGKSEEGTGGTESIFEYYDIYRKMRAYTFKTDAFHGLAAQKQLAAPEGYLQAAHYASLTPEPGDYRRSASYLVNGILEYMAPFEESAKKKVGYVGRKVSEGTNKAER
jgi:hypothetical protein